MIRMTKFSKTTFLVASTLSIATLSPAYAAHRAPPPPSYEQELAQQEDGMVIERPIGGVENDYWFDYRTDIAEARHELKKDLDDVTDTEDRRDAWEEYRSELADARYDYVKEMKEKGYRVGQVRVEPSY